MLDKSPKDINIADIVFAVDESIKMTRCRGKSGCVTKKTRCKTHHLWQGLEQNIHNYLSSISIEKYIKNDEGANFL